MKKYKLEFTAEQLEHIQLALHSHASDIEDCSPDPEREEKVHLSIMEEITKAYK